MGIKPRGGRDHRGAMRGEIDFAREPRAPRRAARRAAGRRARARLRRALQLSPGRRADARRIHGAPARRRCSSPAASRSSPTGCRRASASTTTASNTLEIDDGRLTGRLIGADRRRAGQGARASRRCARATPARTASRSRSATAPTTCRCSRAADVSIAYRAKPVVRAQATYAIDHCGLDAVLNLFA